MSPEAYRLRFDSACLDDFPQLHEALDLGLASGGPDGTISLTDTGLAYADTLGPWLVSPRVRQLMTDQGGAC